MHLGGTFTAKAPNAAQGVEITLVHAAHANSVAPSLLSEQQRPQPGPDALTVTVGPPIGYVVRFTNGLTVYLSGDTGIHSEMKAVVNDFHKANLAVFHLGLTAISAGSAAYAINELIRPASVIMTHASGASTEGGKVRPSSLAATFVSRLKGVRAYPGLSERTMEFDGRGRCVAGCTN